MKEAIRRSGVNATEKHIEYVSICSLLMEAAKKADQAFGAIPKSGAHTVRSAKNNIQKMVEYHEATTSNDELCVACLHIVWHFSDPCISRWKSYSLEGREVQGWKTQHTDTVDERCQADWRPPGDWNLIKTHYTLMITYVQVVVGDQLTCKVWSTSCCGRRGWSGDNDFNSN